LLGEDEKKTGKKSQNISSPDYRLPATGSHSAYAYLLSSVDANLHGTRKQMAWGKASQKMWNRGMWQTSSTT